MRACDNCHDYSLGDCMNEKSEWYGDDRQPYDYCGVWYGNQYAAETYKPILDACCGGRMFWFDKTNPLVIFADNREFSGTLCDGRTFEVKPDIIADYTNLPFEDGSFRLVVFDPPHLTRVSETGWQYKKYGKLPKDWKPHIKQGFDECMRVLADYGILIFKWCEENITVSQIIEAVGQSPLFGHKSGRTRKTHWLCFMKMPNQTLKETAKAADNGAAIVSVMNN